jgi:DnaJ-domain-containing protein 1
MLANYQQHWWFALSGAQHCAPEISSKPGVLRRTLRRVGGQIIVLAFIAVDIRGLGFAVAASVWLAPWVTINLAALLLGTLSWSEDRRIQRESSNATRRQAEKVRAARWWNLEERRREAQRRKQAQIADQLREAEWRRRREEEHEAQGKLQAALCQAEEQLREAEQRRCKEQKEREAQRQQQSEQAERPRSAEHEQKRSRGDGKLEEERAAQRERLRERDWAAIQFQADWWTVLGVAPSASKADIVRNYRRKVKQCHPDRMAGFAPEFLRLAEEKTKILNGAYANAMRTRR